MKGLRMLVNMLLILAILPLTAGCVKTLNGTQVAEVYKTLPAFLGGGYQGRVEPGHRIFYNPLWTNVFVLDTQQITLSWAGEGHGDNPNVNDALNTRAADGNEIWLSITVQYHINPLMTRDVLMNVGYDGDDFKGAVEAYARSKVRSHLGELSASQFYNNTMRYEKIGNAKNELNESLKPFGIIVDNVNLDNHRFDDKYQARINETKSTDQEAQEAFNQIGTVESDKSKMLQEAIGVTNKIIADAEGQAAQAKDTGNAYYTEKENQALAITAEGKNAAAVIAEKIKSLKQSGGESLVRLEIGKQLIASNAPFFLVNRGEGSGNGLDVSKIDYNEIMGRIGKMSAAGENLTGVKQQQMK
jgi:regulator of protease activity HflC (stomatin/prohibitin superfamily)